MTHEASEMTLDADSELMNAPTWAGQGVSIDQVMRAADELRHSDKRAANRTSVATVVMVSRNEDDQKHIEDVLAHLRPRHPARVITVHLPDGIHKQPDNISAGVVMLAGTAQGHDVWSDEIHLQPTGGPAMHTASLLRPLVLADLPVVVWWVGKLPHVEDPLLKLADTVIIDSKEAVKSQENPEGAIPRVFDEIALLSRKNVVADLSWVRIGIWRQMLASQFNGAAYRSFLQGVESVEISGKSSPVTLLAGWIASRLRLDRSVITMSESKHIKIKMRCSLEGRTKNLVIERVDDQPLIHAEMHIQDGPSHEELLAMPDTGVAGSILSVLKRLERDRVYEQSIRLVAGWLD